MEESEDNKKFDAIEEDLAESAERESGKMVQSNTAEDNGKAAKEANMSDDKDDVERKICKIEDQSIELLNQEKQNSITEADTLHQVINEAKIKLKEHKKIINNCEKKMMEVKGIRISRRDYMFGFVQKCFAICLPAVYAIYGTILLNLILSLTNAASDLSVFLWLLGQHHPKTAHIVLGVDYIPGILALTNHLTESLKNQIPIPNIVGECFLVGVLYPLAVPLCYSIFIMARIRGKAVLEERFHYLATMTTVIRTCFEDPFQLLLSIWLFSTRIIPAPWNSRANFCDTLGNCFDLGSTIAIISFILTCFSMVKGTLDGFQSDDYLGLGTSIFINMVFRIVTFSIIIIYLREWILVLLFLLLIINFVVNFKFRDMRSGINILSSSFCSMFQPVVIPDKPEIKAVTGQSTLDLSTVSKTAFWITVIQLPVIFLAGISTYFIVTGLTGFHHDVNIVFTTDQFRYITLFFLPPLFILSLISILVFNYKFTRWITVLVNTLLLMGTATVFGLSFILMPPTPQSLVLLTHQKILGTSSRKLEVAEGLTFSRAFQDIPDEGLVFLCNSFTCKSKQDNTKAFELTFNVQIANPKLTIIEETDIKNTISSLAKVPTDREVTVFLASSKKLEKELDGAECLKCTNVTNSCKSLIQGRKRCIGGFCENFPNDGKIQSLYSKLELPEISKIRSDRCFVKEFLDVSLYGDILEIPYTEGDNLDVQVNCREPFPYPSKNKISFCKTGFCNFKSKATCLGDVWEIEDKCLKCTESSFCRDRRMEENRLGNHCSKETGTCICLKDSDCVDENTNAIDDEQRIIDTTDCRFEGKCNKPTCSTTFNGKTNLIINELGETKLHIHLPHQSCFYERDSIILAVMGGGGGSCRADGCNGGNSGYLVFNKIAIGALKVEDFELSVQVGKGGEENGTSSKVTGPDWWPKVNAEGGISGKFCINDNCMPSENIDTFDDIGTFASGGKPDNPFGEELKVTFPNSGPILRAVSGQFGYTCDVKFDKDNCLGKGGGGGGLSVGSDEDREFLQPDIGFGAGGALGKPGQNGVIVIWSEKVKAYGPEKVSTFDSSAIAGIGVSSIKGAEYGLSCPQHFCKSSANKCCLLILNSHGRAMCPHDC